MGGKLSNPPRDAAAVRMIPPLVPILVVLAGRGLSRIWPVEIALSPELVRLCELIGGLIVGLAVLGVVWCIWLFRRSGQDPSPWKPTPELVAAGPYSYSRNPMYLLMMLLAVGFAVRFLDPWVLLLVPVGAWVLYRLVIRPEEQYLERKFGPSYLAYKRQVRRWL